MDRHATCCDVLCLPRALPCLLVMSNADQPQDAHQEPDRNRSRCWIFSANLNIQKPLNAEQGSDPISSDYFNKVLDDCLPYQDAHLKLEVLSFSFNQDWSHLMSGNALGVTGFIVNKSLLSRRVVEKWLTHEGLDVDWSTCRRDKNPRVTDFLAQSALHDDFFAARAGGGSFLMRRRVLTDCTRFQGIVFNFVALLSILKDILPNIIKQ